MLSHHGLGILFDVGELLRQHGEKTIGVESRSNENGRRLPGCEGGGVLRRFGALAESIDLLLCIGN